MLSQMKDADIQGKDDDGADPRKRGQPSCFSPWHLKKSAHVERADVARFSSC